MLTSELGEDGVQTLVVQGLIFEAKPYCCDARADPEDPSVGVWRIGVLPLWCFTPVGEHTGGKARGQEDIYPEDDDILLYGLLTQNLHF